jgi:hypothetical protein
MQQLRSEVRAERDSGEDTAYDGHRRGVTVTIAAPNL